MSILSILVTFRGETEYFSGKHFTGDKSILYKKPTARMPQINLKS